MNKRSARGLTRYSGGAWWRVNRWFVRPIVDEISRLVQGNDAGLARNVVSRWRLERLRRHSGMQIANVSVAARASDLATNGFLKLDNRFDPATVGRVCQRFQQLINDDRFSSDTRENVSRRLINVVRDIPEIVELLTDEIKEIIQAYYRTYFTVTEVTAWRNSHIPAFKENSDVYSNLWHCDEYFPYRSKLFVNLSDVTQNSGALRLHSIASTKEIMRSGYITRHVVLGAARRLIEDPARVVYLEGKKGSAMLCNTNICLHRAGIPHEGSYRDIVEFKFEPSGIPLAKDWYKKLSSIPEESLAG